jgi:hypothetical protein|tara:strand:+ start:980 stop:1234 length:255 start_codon:yes stop_codon:yes gene_type:complete
MSLKTSLPRILPAFKSAVNSRDSFTIWNSRELTDETNKYVGSFKIIPQHIRFILSKQNDFRVFKNFQGNNAKYIFIPKQKGKIF